MTMFIEKMRVRGDVHIELCNGKGELEDDRWVRNLVVAVGRAYIADQMSAKTLAAMSHMAIGTGTTAAASTDTALQTELDRNVLTSVTHGTGADAHKVTFVCDWPAGDGTGAITEAGIFNSASAGTMLCRTVFGVINKGSGSTLTLTWVISFSA